MKKDFFNEERFLNRDKRSDRKHCDFDNIDLLNLPLCLSSESSTEDREEKKVKFKSSNHCKCEKRDHRCRRSFRHRNLNAGDYSHDHPAGDAFASEKSIFNRLKASVIEEAQNIKHDKNKESIQVFRAKTIPDDDFLVPHYKKNNLKIDEPIIEKRSSKAVNIKRDNKCGHFPFKPTPSGNLKVDSRHVVYESKKFSVLVANPKITTVSLGDKKEQELESREDYDRKMALNALMSKEFGNNSLEALLQVQLNKTRLTRPNCNDEEYEGLSDEKILCQDYITNINPRRIIKWSLVDLPPKRNLYMELYNRISTFSFTDCVVYIDSEEFNCHLIVLQCYSEYFEDFTGVRKVELRSDQVSPPAFAFIYEWMILGDPSYRDLTRENVLDIFSSAKFLKIKDLVEQCWTFIDNHNIFTEISAFVLYVEAKERNLPEVCELMLPRIEKFFLMLVSSRDWLDLDVDDVQNLLMSNYISVNCEMEVFMSAVRWLRHNWEERDHHKIDIMKCVRFGNMDAWQLVDIKRNPDNPEYIRLSKDPEICKMIDDGLAFVIIKYWYGHDNEDYQHWNTILGLKECEPRNWTGDEKTYLSYRDFMIYLDRYRRLEAFAIQKAMRDNYNRLNLSSGPPSESGQSTRSTLLEEFPFVNNKKPSYLRKNFPMIPPRNRKIEIEAVRIIERAYLQHIMKKKLKELKKKLKSPVRNSNQKVSKRSSVLKKILPRPSDLPRFLFKEDATSVYSARVTRDLPKILTPRNLKREKAGGARASCSQKYKKAQYLSEDSLFYLEHESVIVFGGINVHSKYGVGKNTGKDIYRYLPIKNDWEYVGDMPAPRAHHCVAFLSGRIYLVGGSDPREDDVKGKFIVVDTVWSFDPIKKIWYDETPLNVRRKNFGLAVSGNHMYAIGGQDKHSRVINSVEKYNLSKGFWGFVAPMKHPRMGIACTKFEDKIWVAGGMCGSSQRPLTDIVECYNIEHNQWTEVKRLRIPRCFATFFAMSNNLYIIAGAGRNKDGVNNTISFSSIDIWDKEEQVWKKHAEMEVARHGHTAAYLGTQILIIGGVTTVYLRSLSSIECYCTSRGTWIRGMSTLPNCLSGHATVTLPPAVLL